MQAVDRCHVLILPPFSDWLYPSPVRMRDIKCLNLDSHPVLRLSQYAAATVACHYFYNNKNGGKRLWPQRGSSSNTQQTVPCWIAPSYQNNTTSTINTMCCFSRCSAMSVPIWLSLFKLHVHNQSNAQHLTLGTRRDSQLTCYRSDINRHAHGPAEGLFRKKNSTLTSL